MTRLLGVVAGFAQNTIPRPLNKTGQVGPLGLVDPKRETAVVSIEMAGTCGTWVFMGATGSSAGMLCVLAWAILVFGDVCCCQPVSFQWLL